MQTANFINEKRLQKDFESLSELSKDPQGGITRLAYTETETKAHRYVASEAEKIGLKARTDTVGNLYIRMGSETEPAIRIGSHLDSVNNGGNYDGAVGVLTSLEALRCLAQAKAELRYPVELVASQDSQHLANYWIPTGMIFVPSKDGVSHSSEEHTEMKHIAMAARILLTALTEAQNLWGD